MTASAVRSAKSRSDDRPRKPSTERGAHPPILDAALDAVVTMSEEGLITGWNTWPEGTVWLDESASPRPADVGHDYSLPISRQAREGLPGTSWRRVKVGAEKRIEITCAAQRRTRIPCGAGDHACAAGRSWIFSAFCPRYHERKRARRSSASARSCRRWVRPVGLALADSDTLASCPAAVRGGARHASIGPPSPEIWTLNERGRRARTAGECGPLHALERPAWRVPVGQFKIGRIAGVASRT